MAPFTVQINRFDGGLNTKVTPIAGDPDQSPDLKNVTFDDLGAVKTRNGYTKFTSATIQASAPIDGLHSYVKNDGTSQLVAAHNGTLWRMSLNTGITIGSAEKTFTTGTLVKFVTFQNQAWISNGTENPRKWNGTEFTRWGVSAPSAATAVVNSAGTQTGSYKYVVAGINSNSAQGNYGSATSEIDLVAQRAYITSMPIFVTSDGVNNKIIGRNTAGASGVYWVLTQVANAINVFEDNIDDAQLVTLMDVDAGLPKNFTVFVEHLGLMWGASSTGTTPSLLYYSDQNEPEEWGVDNFVRIGEGDGFQITGILEFAGSLVITKSNASGGGSVYLLYTPDSNSDNWSLTRLDTAYGNEARNTFVKFANFAMYLNRNGIYDLNELAVGSVKSDALSFDIESEIFAIATAYMDKAVAINFKNKVWVSVPSGSAQTTNNTILQYDYIKGRGSVQREFGAWSKFTGLDIGTFAIHSGTLYGGDSTADTGLIYTLDSGTNDDSGAIESYYKTMAIRGLQEHENFTKQWRHAYILVEASGDWDMELTYINDFADEDGTVKQIDLTPGLTGVWGSMKWGSGVWGQGVTTKTVRVDFVNSVSKSLQLRFKTNTADQYFKVHDVKLEYTLRGRR